MRDFRPRGKRRPSIKTPCVADRYHAPGERIAEFSTPSGAGGLIRIQELDGGAVVLEVYRVTGDVTVIIPKQEA